VAELALSFAAINKVSGKVELVDGFQPFVRGYTHQELSAYTHEELSEFTHFELMNSTPLCDEQITKDEYWSFKLKDYPFGTYGFNTIIIKNSQAIGFIEGQ
jgi:hypothetical protein